MLMFPMYGAAQARIEVGAAIGMQSYEREADDPRVITSVEAVVQRQRLGAHVALEYADLAFGGALYVTHLNFVYRRRLTQNVSVMIGAGPTYVSQESYGSETTVNVELELSRRFGRTDVFVRGRQFDYDLSGFRDSASPSGPAVYVGARFAVRP